MTSRIVLTGSTGFVGSALAPALGTEHDVRPIDLRRSLPQNAFKDTRILIHLAAIAHRPDSDNHDAEYFRVNRDLTLTLARQAASEGVRHMIHASTSKVSGGPREADASTAMDAYSRSKAEAELGLEDISQETGLHVTCLRPPVIYGPGVKGNIARLFEKVAKRSPLPTGALQAKRSYLGIENLVSAVECVIEHPDGFQVYHVADAEPVATHELVAIAAEVMKVKVRPVLIPRWTLKFAGTLLGRRRDMERLLVDSILDTSKITNRLGWRPPAPTRDGFAAAAKAYAETHP